MTQAQRKEWGEALKVRIRAAFGDVTLGEGVSLREADVLDNYGSDEERKAARLQDELHHWWNVKAEDLEYYYWSLSFFDVPGWRFHIPAYMTWSIDHYQVSASRSSDSAIDTFLTGERIADYCRERFAALNELQSACVAEFLTFMATDADGFVDVGSARQALGQYWGQFSGRRG